MACAVFVLILSIACLTGYFPGDWDTWGNHDGRTVTFQGTVTDKGSKKLYGEPSKYFTVSDVRGIGEDSDFSSAGVICYTDREELPMLGSRCLYRGRLKSFSPARNPGGFDGITYYRTCSLEYMSEGGIILDRSGKYSRLKENLYRVREFLGDRLEKLYSTEYSSVLKAMLLGDKQDMDDELKSLYQKNGIVHILAISALHISILGAAVSGILKIAHVPEWAAFLFSCIFMVLYGLMINAGPSSVRAVIMFMISAIARALGRTYDMLTALGLSAVIILAGEPLYLFNSGFLFSFAAVLGLCAFVPVFTPETPEWISFLEEDSKKRGISALKRKLMLIPGKLFKLSGESISGSLAVLFMTLPVHVEFYYVFPPYSLILNLVVIPFMTLVVTLGALSLAMGSIVIIPGVIIGIPVAGILELYEYLCRFFARLPGSNIILGKALTLQTIIYLSLMGIASHIFVYFKFKKEKPKYYRCFSIALIIIAVFVLLVRPFNGLEIVAVDVGQGDCFLIRTEDTALLVDGGSSSSQKAGENIILPCLKALGVKRLACVLISHWDADHMNGIAQILEMEDMGGLSIDSILLPDTGGQAINENYDDLIKKAASHGISVSSVTAGDVIRQGDMKIDCLWPSKGLKGDDINEFSMILSLKYKKFSMLFTGDAGEETEKKLKALMDEADTYTVLKVGHHGSRFSSTEAFLDAVRPRTGIISVGRNNRYGHPAKDTLDRMSDRNIPVVRTDERGAIFISTDGAGVKIRGYLDR